MHTNEVFIENGRFHGALIAEKISRASRNKTSGLGSKAGFQYSLKQNTVFEPSGDKTILTVLQWFVHLHLEQPVFPMGDTRMKSGRALSLRLLGSVGRVQGALGRPCPPFETATASPG